jgi:VWFA-related protein
MRTAALALLLFFQLGETLEIRVTNVDVVVTDRAGKPVRGLTRDDFVILEDKKPQTITNFAEYEEEAPASLAADPNAPGAPAAVVQRRPPRHIVLLLDDTTVDPFVRKQLFDSLIKAIPNLVQPGDEAMLATWTGSIHIQQPFTDHADAIVKAIKDDLERGGGLQYMANTHDALRDINMPMGGSRMPSRQAEMIRTTIRMWTTRRLTEERNFIAGAKRLVGTLAGLEGRKLLLLATGYMPVEPGAEIAEYAMSKYPTLGITRPTDNLHAEHEDLAAVANASGVAIDSIYPNLDLGAEGAERAMGDFNRNHMTFTEVTNTSAALVNLAQMTGGTAFTQVKDFAGVIENFRQQLSSYYSLGYRSPSKSGRHAIAVQLKNHPEYRVVARNSYQPKSPDETARDRAVADLFHEPKGDFEVQIQPGKAEKQGRDRYVVPLRVVFPNKIVLLPEGSDFTGSYTVYIAVAGRDGDLAPVGTQEQPIRLNAEQKAQMEGKLLGSQFQLLVRGGEQTVSIVVRDDVGGAIGVGRAKIKPDA